MFSKKFKDCCTAILIAASFAATGIVFAEVVANKIGYTYNPLSQVKDK